jgi:Tol biopolymer transport system component
MSASARPFLLASAIALSTIGFVAAPTPIRTSPVAFPGGNGFIVTSVENVTGAGINHVLFRWVRNGSTWTYKQLTQTGNPTTPRDDTSPSYSPSGKRVVFVRDGDVWVVTNAGNTTRLTRTKAADADPTYTPDGHIVWTAGKRLHEMNADGSHPVDIGIEGHDASVSPDGTWVAFTRFDQQQAANHVFKAHLDGTHIIDLTPHAATHQQNPDWSPDGTHLVFQQLNPRTHHFRIAVMRADGSNVTPVATNAGADLTQPVYSPNGKKIAYRAPDSPSTTVLVVDLATGQTEANLYTGDYDDAQPTWQPT